MLQQLIVGCQQSNPTAQRDLFRHFAPTMMTVARRYAHQHTEAEDILQEAFVKIFRSFHQFSGERGSLEGWIRRIVVNTAIQHWRKFNKNYTFVGEDQIPEPAVQATADLHFSEEQLLHLIQDLPPGFRVVFNLYALEGYSHAEIAEQLGIAESASRSQLSRARKQLQLALASLQKLALT